MTMALGPRDNSQFGMEGVSPVGVPYQTFLALLWAGVGVSAVFLAGRLLSRMRMQRRFFIDDYLTMFAFVLVALTASLWQWAAKDMYFVLDVQAGLKPFELDFFDRMIRFLRVMLAVELFFYTSLVCVKLSLLFFFRRLDANVNYLSWYWWAAMTMTLVCYFVSVGDVEYRCLAGTIKDVVGYCTQQKAKDFIDLTLRLNCALDVISEFLIMVLPFILLWNVRLRLSKKVLLATLFSLSLLTMAIAIARAASIDATRRPDGVIDNTYLWMWSSIEPPIAIMVSCLSAFPSLFSGSASKEKKKFKPSETYLRMMSRIRSSQKNSNGEKTADVTLIDMSMVSRSDGFDYVRAPESRGNDSQDSRQQVLVPADQYGRPYMGQQHPHAAPDGANQQNWNNV